MTDDDADRRAAEFLDSDVASFVIAPEDRERIQPALAAAIREAVAAERERCARTASAISAAASTCPFGTLHAAVPAEVWVGDAAKKIATNIREGNP